MNKQELEQQILQKAMNTAKQMINESKSRAPWKKPKHRVRHRKQADIYQTFSPREKELNDMFVKKFGPDTPEQIKIVSDKNFGGTEAQCKSFRMKRGIVWFKTIYGEDVNIGNLCNVDDEDNSITGYNDPNENYNIVKSWCDDIVVHKNLREWESELANKYRKHSEYMKDGHKYSADIGLKEPFKFGEQIKPGDLKYFDTDEMAIHAFYTHKNRLYLTDECGDSDTNMLSETELRRFLEYISDENNLEFYH